MMKLLTSVSKHLPAVLLLCCSSAMASSSLEGFKVAVIEDSIASDNIIAGNYLQGINELANKPNSSDRFAHLMSLCVAQIKTYKLEAAESSCSGAVSAITTKASRGRQGKLLKALAYSNRGIARYLNNDNVKAFEDFAAAKSLSNDKIIADNISYFSQSTRSPVALAETSELAD